jgi:hypothetical protein
VTLPLHTKARLIQPSLNKFVPDVEAHHNLELLGKNAAHVAPLPSHRRTRYGASHADRPRAHR